MDKHRTALVLFAVALGVVIVIASVTTVEQVKAQKVSADAASGTTGLSKPYPPLAPGEPILKDRWLPSPGDLVLLLALQLLEKLGRQPAASAVPT